MTLGDLEILTTVMHAGFGCMLFAVGYLGGVFSA